MRVLDGFCGPGGAGEGYRRAGFDVVGVDIDPQPHYPFEFHQDDAMKVLETLVNGGTWQGYKLEDFDLIHCSPPCQEYSVSRPTRTFKKQTVKEHPMLIAPVLKLLRSCKVPWIVENVAGAKKDMPDALELCGVAFGLPLLRHRLFLSSELLFAPSHCKHPEGFYNVVGGKVRGHGAFRSKVTYVDRKGRTRIREGCFPKAKGQEAMGIDWMTLKEMSQAIPPCYTEWLGMQIVWQLEAAA